MQYSTSDNPKSLRETLCVAQSCIGNSSLHSHEIRKHLDVLQRLINECDRHRLLGVNGKHSNLHTDTCGCDEKGPRETWAVITPLFHGYSINPATGDKESLCGMSVPIWTFALIPETITCVMCKEIMKEDDGGV